MNREPRWRRYRNRLRPRPTEDVSDEVRFHLEMREEEARRAGLAPDDARAAARERFGDVAGARRASLAAMLLGAVSIYGVMSYLVGQRAHEMGVRIALGATSRDIFGLVLGRGARLAVAGAVIGAGGASIATRPLRSLLYGISATDPITFATIPVLFVVVALAASFGPARRATRADPVDALRTD